MSYQTGTATSPEDLVTKLFTFLTGTPGWTQNYLDTVNDRASITSPSGNINHNLSWDSTDIFTMMSTGLASPLGSVEIRLEPGAESPTTSAQQKRINIGAGPYTAYHFFEDDGYCHMVVEWTSGLFRHMGWGQLVMTSNAHTTGDYSFGTYWSQSTSDIDVPTDSTHACGFAGGVRQSPFERSLSIYLPNWPDGGTGKWFLETESALTVDPDGDPRWNLRTHGWQGGSLFNFMGIGNSQLNGFKPLMPPAVYTDFLGSAPDRLRLVGFPPDLRIINLDGVTVGEDLSVGGETWVPFPIVRKIYVPGTTFNEEQSFNFGYAYKKVTT